MTRRGRGKSNIPTPTPAKFDGPNGKQQPKVTKAQIRAAISNSAPDNFTAAAGNKRKASQTVCPDQSASDKLKSRKISNNVSQRPMMENLIDFDDSSPEGILSDSDNNDVSTLDSSKPNSANPASEINVTNSSQLDLNLSQIIDVSSQSPQSLTLPSLSLPPIGVTVSSNPTPSPLFDLSSVSSFPPLTTKASPLRNPITNTNHSSSSIPSLYQKQIVINNPIPLADIPNDLRKVHITSLNPSFVLSKLNPIKLASSFDTLCGQIENIQHIKTGALIITCSNFEQVKKLLSLSELPFSPSNISVKVEIALGTQTSKGKIYAPELLDVPLSDLKNALEGEGVVSISKLLRDPTKADVPLFLLTFFGQLPSHVKIRYSRFRVDPYVPSPLFCKRCSTFGHIRATCPSQLKCSRCAKKGHSIENCPSDTLCCPNCHGEHSALSGDCPVYAREKQISQIRSSQRLTYPEAKKVLELRPAPADTVPPQQYLPTLNNNDFPFLPSPSQNNFHPSASPRLVQSAGSDWFPPQQVRRNPEQILSQSRNQTPAYTNSFQPEILSLPSLNSSSTFQPASSSNQAKNLPTETQISSLVPLLLPIIPFIIKLMLCETLSSKIECFMEMAALLNIETAVSSAIAGLGISSLSSSQPT